MLGVDYLFVDSALPGLRRNSMDDVEEIERKLSTSHIEALKEVKA